MKSGNHFHKADIRWHCSDLVRSEKNFTSYAVDRLLELAEYIEPESNVIRDLFANGHCFEKRHPIVAAEMSAWLQSYERNRESALAILSFLEKPFEVNGTIAKATREYYA